MKIFLAILLNAALLALLLPWLLRQWRWAGPRWWRLALVGGMALRLGLGIARNWTPKLDAAFMSNLSQQVTAQLWAAPASAFNTLTQAVTIIRIQNEAGADYQAVYQGLSNTWFLIKLLALLNFGSLGIGAINGFYLSLFAFVGCWQLVRKLAEVLPGTPAGAGVVAFLLWPSVWFWSTGISKEAVLLGSGAWLTARIVEQLYDRARPVAKPIWRQLRWWLGTIVLAFVHFKMRYFFAVPLLGVLAAVALLAGLKQINVVQARWAQVAVLAAVLATGVWLAPLISRGFTANKFTNQVIKVYTFEAYHSAGKPHFEYPALRPTIESFVAHAPLAVANTLTRPWLGESRLPMYVVAGLENALLLGLLLLAVIGVGRGRGGCLPFELGLGLAIFCLILAFLIGLTTPNLGSLNRYRSELMPFLVLLLLQNDYAAAWLRRVELGGPPTAGL
ncbi:hypothetical protein I2I05_09110 [Hymenobacter sp. BT683]|uniref:Glycosyltransferase RgtA/B/C/D-like domain-containing protein n=1 Tax=Hymenobacter jeongseonensis TaxID=2791027 RepID=A0ABS0IGS7_9BACT|nr:hypothetical protein [Hymenobacter jeongseonensis]MBF9237551.1 hypothetical protein [Hymenobacter jeongseonensis]